MGTIPTGRLGKSLLNTRDFPNPDRFIIMLWGNDVAFANTNPPVWVTFQPWNVLNN